MNNPRTIQLITKGSAHSVGPFHILQPLPTQDLQQISPFILLHHAPLKHIGSNEDNGRVSPHPHRGFEPVTFLFEGGIYHRDSMGNEGFLESTGVQWMTSGSGVIHSEGPSPTFLKNGGNLEMIQLWVNLSAKNKMTEPAYQMIPAAKMPSISEEIGVHLRLVAGNYKSLKGPATTFSPITAIMGDVEANRSFIFETPVMHNALVYLLSGKINVNSTTLVAAQHLIALNNNGDHVHIEVLENARFLLLSGEPINEPLATHGPFVMNTQQELHQAILDYQSGKMGVLQGE